MAQAGEYLCIYSQSKLSTSVKNQLKTITERSYYNVHGLLTKREVKMTGYWPNSFFFFMDRDRVEVYKHAKKNVEAFSFHVLTVTENIFNGTNCELKFW